MSGEITRSIGGYHTLSGGTRTAVKTHRPWQPKLVFPKSTDDCPFCSKEQADEFHPVPDWKTFANANTPWPYHRLLVPATCWNEEALRSLGGPDTLRQTLRLCYDEALRTRGSNLMPVWIYTHIGYGAGQNFAHHHWHISAPVTTPKPVELDGEEELWENDGLRVTLYGVRAGQVLITPRDPGPFSTSTIASVAREASRVVDVFNRKFEWPDYCLFLGIHTPREWFVRYTPILNNWGGADFAALDFGTPFVLPWPHRATAAHLLS